jgi:hypothetical protein
MCIYCCSINAKSPPSKYCIVGKDVNIDICLRNRKQFACFYGVVMHEGNVRRIREKRVKHEAFLLGSYSVLIC